VGKYRFLAGFYLKALFMMKLIGNASGAFIERKRTQWEQVYESVRGHDTWLVIGNGPSLQVQDIEAFHELGIPTIASNKINILFNRTAWRPTIYTIGDALLLHKLPASHFDDFDRVFLPTKYRFMARGKNLMPWRHIFDGPGERKYTVDGETLSPLNGFFPGSTITCANLQFAMWAGAKTIYLIGCDHFYANETSSQSLKTKKGVHREGSNHFDPNYRKPGEIVNEAPVKNMNNGYRIVRKVADQRGIRIVNISRRTALEAFERGTVEDALADIRHSANAGAANELHAG
jgi:hypothetical protein